MAFGTSPSHFRVAVDVRGGQKLPTFSLGNRAQFVQRVVLVYGQCCDVDWIMSRHRNTNLAASIADKPLDCAVVRSVWDLNEGHAILPAKRHSRPVVPLPHAEVFGGTVEVADDWFKMLNAVIFKSEVQFLRVAVQFHLMPALVTEPNGPRL